MKVNYSGKKSLWTWLMLVVGFQATLFSGYAQSDKGFYIEVEIKDIPDSVLYLANYYGDKTYLTDTAYRDNKGNFTFEADTLLPGGIYILAGQTNNKYFELIIDQGQRFKVQSNLSGLFSDIKFKNSIENELFYRYINFNVNLQKEIQQQSADKKRLDPGNDSIELIDKTIADMRIRLDSVKQQIIVKGDGSFVSVLLRAMDDPDPADFPLTSNQREDSVFMYQYYKNHYWDQFNPADARLLRTPLYHRKLETFFTKVVFQHPDSIILEIDKFVAKLDSNPETFKYTVWYLTYKFETSNIMGFDEIFVHMVDRYYLTGKAFWTSESTIKTLKQRADALRNILIGTPAPNMILLDTSGGFKSLYQQNALYLIVFFYESDCSHCRKEIKALKKWDETDTLNVKVFAVCTDTNLVKWKKYIRDQDLNWVHVNGTRSVTPDYHGLYDINVTPTIFLLDENKKILAKRLKVEQLIPFIEHHAAIRLRRD
ncbi:MAG: redoxin domain-containing protein [Bacteroidetes bacterium]|nr:redoxin domain-containing protein [Bacteroidota bacterium]